MLSGSSGKCSDSLSVFIKAFFVKNYKNETEKSAIPGAGRRRIVVLL